jgi:hypothetical protein
MSKSAEDERFEKDEEKEEVEGHMHHGRGRAMTDDAPKSDEDSSDDDFEAHMHQGRGRS